MLHIKLQLGCLIILLYVAFIYLKEYKKNHGKLKDTFFDELLILGISSVILDGATAYTVNHLDTVNPVLNKILHVLFLGSLDSVIFALFLYMLHMTGAFPKKKYAKIMIFIPFILNIITLFCCMGSLEYVHGKVTNYSMGPSVYTCFAMAAVYIVMTIVTFFRRLDHIERHKRMGIITYMLVLAARAVR